MLQLSARGPVCLLTGESRCPEAKPGKIEQEDRRGTSPSSCDQRGADTCWPAQAAILEHGRAGLGWAEGGMEEPMSGPVRPVFY